MRYQKLSYIGLFSAAAILLGYIETFLPAAPVPGIKLGLANLAVVLALYLYGMKEAVFISFVRILTLGFLFGNLFSILYSLSGAALSLILMGILKKTKKFSIITVSMAGGIGHNTGQLIAAAAVVENIRLFYYLPVLLISGFLTGWGIGYIVGQVKKRIGAVIKKC